MITRLTGLWTDHPVAAWLVLLACAGLVLAAVRLTVIDIRSHRLPDRIVFPSFGAAMVLLLAAGFAAGDFRTAVRTLLGAMVLGAFYLLLRLIYPAGMGLGDVKLAALLGLYLGYLGWPQVLFGTMTGFLLGGLCGIVLIVTRLGGPKTQIPFGPFMLAGALAVMLVPAG
ncbi:MAG: A24 family peptidase [Actinomycetota bacterium]|uniref:A24 family peptidase n=1 Tax=Micrococcaceae TaxID=1268 RepID=UPI0024B89E1B|nr:A24 family peptidase [Paenarthrobacter sp. PH39-S1]MDJ0354755.1 A24 family peptidase [Paenarthrobacter sp. PH39-S1]MDQ6740126.1 A24 family peptidase [Actinomycetota bacterium]